VTPFFFFFVVFFLIFFPCPPYLPPSVFTPLSSRFVRSSVRPFLYCSRRSSFLSRDGRWSVEGLFGTRIRVFFLWDCRRLFFRTSSFSFFLGFLISLTEVSLLSDAHPFFDFPSSFKPRTPCLVCSGSFIPRLPS